MTTTFNHLPCELQEKIYLMKHQLEMKDVMTQLIKRIGTFKYIGHSFIPYQCRCGLKLWYPNGMAMNPMIKIIHMIKLGLYETDIIYENVYREFQPEQFLFFGEEESDDE